MPLNPLEIQQSQKEKAPNGEKDENVFDIKQGVAIGIFVKKPGGKGAQSIRHTDLWGTRSSKYTWLYESSVETVKWADIPTAHEGRLFIPQDDSIRKEYMAGWRVQDIFSLNGDPAPGIVTTHDDFAISWSREEAFKKVEDLLGTGNETEAREQFTLCSQSQWSYDRAKRELPDENWRSQATPLLYRPFDVRWTIWNRNVAVHRRERVNTHLRQGSLGLMCMRQVALDAPYSHFGVTRIPVDNRAFYSNKGIMAVCPLYLYGNDSSDFFSAGSQNSRNGRRPNISANLVDELRRKLGLRFDSNGGGDLKRSIGPEDICFLRLCRFLFPHLPFALCTVLES